MSSTIEIRTIGVAGSDSYDYFSTQELVEPPYSPLSAALRMGHLDLARNLIGEGAVLEREAARQYLSFGVDLLDFDMVDVALLACPDVSPYDFDGVLFLDRVLYRGEVEIAHRLLEAGFVSCKGAREKAFRRMRARYFTTLIAAGGDLPLAEAFSLALLSQDEATIRDFGQAAPELLEEMTVWGISPIQFATYHKKNRSLLVLLEMGVDPNSSPVNGMHPLQVAVFLHDPIATTALLQAGADPNRDISDTRGLRLLSFASNPGEFLAFGAQKTHLYALEQLIEGGKDDAFQAHFLQHREEVDRLGIEYLMMVAIDSERIFSLSLLLREQPRINRLFWLGPTTFLSEAVNSGCFQVVEKLIESGADPNVPGKDGELPLALAARKRLAFQSGRDAKQIKQIVRLLLLKGADSRRVDWNRNPYFCAHVLVKEELEWHEVAKVFAVSLSIGGLILP